MRNLRNIRHSVVRAPSDITATCWDAGKDEVLVACGPTEYDARIELLRVVENPSPQVPELQCERIAAWDAPSPNPDLLVDRIVNLHYFGDTQTACLVLAGGDIVIVKEEDFPSPDGVHIEIVGSIDAGIKTARWSPDEELIVISTGADTLVFMSRGFDAIAEATMTSDDLKASKHVSVGWGKKETQFQGKGAKALRDPTIPEKVDEGVLSASDDGRTTISWRGDGAYVAINSIVSGSRRVIRVYTREGVLDSVSEPVDGLEGSLSWRPAGNLMAVIQRLADRVDVIFFERNGLKHGQFTLRAPEALSESITLEWNSDSTVLAVILKSAIQLWTMGNYHWYLKQEISLQTPKPLISWHPEKPLRLATAASDDLIQQEYVFTTCRGSMKPPHDHGAIAVIDGQTVKVTAFRTANVPPPMAMFELQAKSNIVDVAFSHDNSALAILHQTGIDLYQWQTKGPRSLIPKLLSKVDFETSEDAVLSGGVLRISFAGKGELSLLHYNQDQKLSRFLFEADTPESLRFETDIATPIESLRMQFLANVGLFLDQLQDVTYIDLFLSSLREEDVTQTMYKNTKPAKKIDAGIVLPNGQTATAAPTLLATTKVNTICDAVLKSLRTRQDTNLQNIITAHVCKTPPALDDGLLVVAELMQEDDSLAERAVEHICFLQDVNRLYDHALGLYNLDLALLVAQQSQRDPREYLPFIQTLHQMSDLRRRFTIDDHLGRREKALAHLQTLHAFDEVQNYTTKHNLYQIALKLYRYEPEHHKNLTDLYAAYLESRSQFRDAGLAYESLGNFAKATSCYRAAGAGAWHLAGTLAEALYETKDYASAARIHDEYLSSTDSAVRCLCKGYHFADAMRLAVLRNRPELLESTIDTGLADALSSSTELLADCKAQLRAQVPRIAELRKKAAEDPLAFYEGERPSGLGDVPDDVSIAASSRVSTSASLFTRYTGKSGSVGTLGSNVSRATSKNRKREEKKRARGRKGTVYEEEYLVNSVRRLVERVEETKGEVEKLVFGLMRRGMAERARAIEALMDEIVEACRVAIKEVFGNGEEEKPQAQEGEDPIYHPSGADAVFQESLEASRVKQAPPVITAFKRLSLLG
ncbi:putative elongator complex protein [Phaeoacremonium minimum UCRPA7]|uniref:Putative elongator complex protein n=1 Tax=Phaeoacremonium minimum (strain UCR-PA7) TaxID=1286976 RepID=R8BL01_PHAM7|nr:putative elongator complex protein [Phaeoacremonium minimum UCRPA7]EOO00048.1 putative elongator complex protein [Phaeoacremonium minimum UCRPA7]